MNHLDDDAELYALGLTERERDAEIEAHLATCDGCRTRVAAAEEAAASLAATLPAMPPAQVVAAPSRAGLPSTLPATPMRRAWWTGLASAAAVVFAATAAFEGMSAHGASSQLARTDVALNAIAGSHFGHTTLTSVPGVVAKALYARDGSWLYVVATGAPRGAHVVLRRSMHVTPKGTHVTPDAGATAHPDAAVVDVGVLESGEPATLFVRDVGRAGDIAIVPNGQAVAHAVAHGVPAY
ncbi:MAG: hypothetical protein QOD51_899 [Candidatus Eremiobacteraeota bacterium]|jgi:hypothetical protein|nr:hypothetical protein [Candidatus Eremiobacteraeota bacterium]